MTLAFKSTCDLYDEHLDAARVPTVSLLNLGGRRQLCGSAVTVKCFEDNSRIKELVATPGEGRVMLVEDDMVDESLILKFMLPELTMDKDSTERFKREVKYARKVSHRNVIRVHDILLKDNRALLLEYGLQDIFGCQRVGQNHPQHSNFLGMFADTQPRPGNKRLACLSLVFLQ